MIPPGWNRLRRSGWTCRSSTGRRPGWTPILLRSPSLPRRPWRPGGARSAGGSGSFCWRFPTTTYGALTEALKAAGVPASPQAVGGAVGHNPISILIPCHRVVGADGSLTGYAGGVEKKRFLLELEGADLTGLYIPTKGTAL